MRYEWDEISGKVDIVATYQHFFPGKKVGRASRRVVAQCPGGSDTNPSLQLYTEQTPHKFYCFHCGRKGDAVELLQLGEVAPDFRSALSMIVEANLAGVVPQQVESFRHVPSSRKLQGESITGCYVYCDIESRPLLQIERITGADENGEMQKRFRQTHRCYEEVCVECTAGLKSLRNMATRDKWSIGGIAKMEERFGSLREGGIVLGHSGEYRFGGIGRTEWIPYCLPELMKLGRTDAVFLVEGEKKVDALRSLLGLNATCAPNGGTWVMPKEWAGKYFGKVRSVIILPDCDETGREKCAIPRLHMLKEQGVRAEIVDLAPERNDHYDIADWIEERVKQGIPTAQMLDELRALRAKNLTSASAIGTGN
ncbi:MAG: CHC2 zinc finger domain-containing protein [Vulcanimicrobiaceae bacterium]